MKTLYLIRHAKSGWDDLSVRDFDRTLSNKGLLDAPVMADFLVKEATERGGQPDLIISSTAKRAMMTAQIFADAFGIAASKIVGEKEIYDAFVSNIVKLINNLPYEANVALMFGHNPTFTSVANWFSKETYVNDMPTCSIVRLEANVADWKGFDRDTADLTGFWYPQV